jgi:Flp pilus assembly protein TadG
MQMRNPVKFHSSEEGSSLVEMAVFIPVLLTVLLAVVDLGRAYYLTNEVAAAAHEAAVFGSQNPTDTADMKTVAQNAAPDVPGISATTSYGCECADGSNASASCVATPSCGSLNSVHYVKVTATATYTPLVPWPKFGSSFTLTQTVQMRGQ